MRHGVSSYSFASFLYSKKMNLYDIVQKAAELGFEGLELANIYDDWMGIEVDLEKLKKTAEEAHIELCSWAASADYACRDTSTEIARVKKEVDDAAYLGCKIFRSDICQEGVPDRYAPRIIEAIREIAEHCRTKGMVLVTENHGRCFCRPERLEELCRRVDHPNFGLLCDFANYAIADVDAIQAIGQIRTLVRHVHMKDCHLLNGDRIFPGDGWHNTIGGNYWRCAITGQGNIPYFQCIKSLKEAGYDGWLIQEFEGIEDCIYAVEQGLCYAKRLLSALDFDAWKKEQ